MTREDGRRIPPPFGPTKLARDLAARIGRSGPITFAEFMREALYSPHGYYRGGGRIAATGDFFTAPSAHPAFGAMLALQLHDLWRVRGSPDVFTVVEMGAADGLLARDFTAYASAATPEFSNALDYRAFDEVTGMAEHYEVQPLSALPRGVTGAVLSNEMLDAMPVHRFVIENGRVREVFVGVRGGELVEVIDEPSTPLLSRRIGSLTGALPDGYRGEVNLGLDEWADRVENVLRTGHVITIDYGFDRASLYSLNRSSGSLRCYYRHTLSQDPLARVGLQDITAHVDFTAVDDALGAHGFRHVGRTTQAEFLSNLGIGQWVDEFNRSAADKSYRRADLVGLLQLINPAGMGAFIVDVHGRGVDEVPVKGLAREPSPTPGAPPPTLGDYPGHVDLTGASPSSGQWFQIESFEHLFSDEP